MVREMVVSESEAVMVIWLLVTSQRMSARIGSEFFGLITLEIITAVLSMADFDTMSFILRLF